MKNIALRQADPAREFGEIGVLFLLEQGELALELISWSIMRSIKSEFSV